MNCPRCGETISPGYARLKQYNDMEILFCDSCGAFSTGNECALATELERMRGEKATFIRDIERLDVELRACRRRAHDLKIQMDRVASEDIVLYEALMGIRHLANQARTDSGDVDPMGWIYERADVALAEVQ